MITVEQWESEEFQSDDTFEPRLVYTDFQVAQMLVHLKPSGRLIYFVGQKTGVKLHPNFADVLEGK